MCLIYTFGGVAGSHESHDYAYIGVLGFPEAADNAPSLEEPLRSLSLKKTLPKLAVLVAGLTVATMAATGHSAPAQAVPSFGATCTQCHLGAAGSVTAVPSNPTPAPGAAYTVAINVVGVAGNYGYSLTLNGSTTPILTGAPQSGAAFSAAMTAPATAGTYVYTVHADRGAPPGSPSTVNYTITVAAAPTAVTTTTALAVTPASPVVAPASPTLTATVTGTGAAGAVQFLDGATLLGTPVTVAGGSATKALTGVVAGTHSYTARFIPTSAAAFTTSTSAAVAYLVTAVPFTGVTTTTALAVTPASPVVAPASLSLKATVTGTGAVGTVQFLDGTTPLGVPVAVVDGVASKSLTGVVAGTHSYKAVFTPTNAALFSASTSAAATYVVTGTQVVVTPPQVVVPPAGGVDTGDGSTSIG